MLVLALSLLAAPQSTWLVDATASGPGTGTAADPYSRVDYAVAQPTTVNGDTLQIADGTYVNEQISMGSKELVLEAAPGATPVLVSINSESLLTADVSSRLTARGLRFQSPSLGSDGPFQGGAIRFTGLELLVEDCSFAQLGALQGGAIYASGGPVTLRNVTFDVTCSAGWRGGALWSDSSSVTIEASSLDGSAPFDDGGGVFFEGGSLEITDSSLRGAAQASGGAINVAQGDLTLRRCEITGRSVEDHSGGGLNQLAGTSVIEGCTFQDCSAIRGGAIYSLAETMTLTDSVFFNNRTTSIITMNAGSGGAVSASNGTIERCVFRSNRANHHPDCSAGAISGRVSVSFCTFVDNEASSLGSDVRLFAPSPTDTRAFEGNILRGTGSVGVPLVSAGTGVIVRHNLSNRAIPGTMNTLGDASFWSVDMLRLLPDSPAIDLLPASYGTDPDGTRRDAGAFPFEFDYCGTGCDGPIGTPNCIALPNSTGAPSTIHGYGSPVISTDRLVLNVEGLPTGAFGFFIASLTPSYVPGAGGSAGAICVGGSVLRFSNSALQATPNFGSVSFRPRLGDFPGGNAVQSGDLWYFQYWHRDAVASMPTSNFSPSLAVQY